jgi:hypothetical protein
MEPKRQALPKIPMDHSPWTRDTVTRYVTVAGEPLTKFEYKLVVRASIYSQQFKPNGEYKYGEKLTGWEKDLVRAARKWPIETNIEDIEGLKRSKSPEARMGDEEEVEEQKERGKSEEMEGIEEATEETVTEPVTKAQEPALNDTTTPDLSKSKWASEKSEKSTHHTQRPNPPDQTRADPLPSRASRPLPPRAYQPTESFRILKKRILSNAHSYFSHRFPKAGRFDLITSSDTPRNLSSTRWQAALIVYPDPSRRDWRVLYKSNACPTIEDASFEVKFWIEEDMWDILSEIKEGETWTKAKSNRLEESAKKTKAQERAASGKKEAENSRARNTAEPEGKQKQDTTIKPTTAFLPAHGLSPPNTAYPASATSIASLTSTSDLKRAHAADEDEDNGPNKCIKALDDAPVLIIGRENLQHLMGDEDAAAYTKIFDGDIGGQ